MNTSAQSPATHFEPVLDSAYFFAYSPAKACRIQWKQWLQVFALSVVFYGVLTREMSHTGINSFWLVVMVVIFPLETIIIQWMLFSFRVLRVSSDGLELRFLGQVKSSMAWDEMVRVHKVTGDNKAFLLLNDSETFTRWWRAPAFNAPNLGQKIMAISPAALAEPDTFTAAVRELAPEGNRLRSYLNESRS